MTSIHESNFGRFTSSLHSRTSLSLRGTKCRSNLEGRNYCLRLPRFARNDKKCLYSQTKRMMCDMYRYLVVFEKVGNNYSAYSPDIPGCIATGSTRDEAEKNIREAISFHIEGLKEDGLPLPEPASFTEYVEVQ